MDELEGLPLSMRDIGNLAPVIDFGEEVPLAGRAAAC